MVRGFHERPAADRSSSYGHIVLRALYCSGFHNYWEMVWGMRYCDVYVVAHNTADIAWSPRKGDGDKVNSVAPFLVDLLVPRETATRVGPREG